MTPNISDIPGSIILISATFFNKVLLSMRRTIGGLFLHVKGYLNAASHHGFASWLRLTCTSR